MATDRERVLEKSIHQLQNTFEHVSNIYDQLRVKSLGVLAGEVALVTFMFSGNGISMPEVVYGKIFLFVGIACLGLAFGLMLWTLSPLHWMIPYDNYTSGELKKKYPTYERFLEYLNDDTRTAVEHCLPRVSKKAKRFSWTLYLLSIGATILMVIKYGG